MKDKQGDRFLEELDRARQEVEKRQRLANFKALMANADKDICPKCGAVRDTYQEQMHEDCSHGH